MGRIMGALDHERDGRNARVRDRAGQPAVRSPHTRWTDGCRPDRSDIDEKRKYRNSGTQQSKTHPNHQPSRFATSVRDADPVARTLMVKGTNLAVGYTYRSYRSHLFDLRLL